MGIDEHRRGRPRWRLDADSGEYILLADRWYTCFSGLSGGQGLLGQVEGRTADDAAHWLAQATLAWRDAIRAVAIDMCSALGAGVAACGSSSTSSTASPTPQASPWASSSMTATEQALSGDTIISSGRSTQRHVWLRYLPAEGPCECDLYLTCAKFLTTPEYVPRLRARLEVEQQRRLRSPCRGPFR